MKVYVVLHTWENRRSYILPDIEKIVATESEAYKIAYDGQYRWIRQFIINTAECCDEKDIRPRRANHVWSHKDLDTLMTLYKEEISDMSEYEQDIWTVHSYDLDLDALSLRRIEV